MLRLEGIRFAYAPDLPPYRFDMVAQPGAVTAIMGASGSGKSTLLDLIAGFLQPQGGTMTLDDLDLLPLQPEARPVSLLFQSNTLFEHLSAASNVALGLPRHTRRKDIGPLVTGALAEVGLAGVEKQRAATLSGGQKQRVALARTLLRNKPVLLLDEPFSALDDATRASARDLVRALTKTHAWTTILVSHHTEDVEALASHRYRIASGVLLPEGNAAA
jgi:thiamine transport system ATP-binding protein